LTFIFFFFWRYFHYIPNEFFAQYVHYNILYTLWFVDEQLLSMLCNNLCRFSSLIIAFCDLFWEIHFSLQLHEDNLVKLYILNLTHEELRFIFYFLCLWYEEWTFIFSYRYLVELITSITKTSEHWGSLVIALVTVNVQVLSMSSLFCSSVWLVVCTCTGTILCNWVHISNVANFISFSIWHCKTSFSKYACLAYSWLFVFPYKLENLLVSFNKNYLLGSWLKLS
jgi:hypothetical protein